MILIAHNIRSLHNVGSFFRSADAFGIEKMDLTGYTAVPPRQEIAKTALGSEDRMPWEHEDDILSLLSHLKQTGKTIVALETREGSEPMTEFLAKHSDNDFVVIVGNEVTGIEKEILAVVDAIVEIPLLGRKQSLNVSVAAGIALFAFTARNR